jgi:oligogalacturonide lyase
MAAVGAVTPSEWRRYADPATELEVFRLTDPAFASGMTAPHLRQFTRRGESLLYWSERSGTRQAHLLDMKNGESKELTDGAAFDSASLALAADDKSFFFFDGPVLNEVPFGVGKAREVHRTPDGAARTGFGLMQDGAAVFVERHNGRSRILTVLKQQPRRIVDTDGEIETVMPRPRRAQLAYRAGDAIFLVNADGSGKHQPKLAPGRPEDASWTPAGRTLIYLHVPEDPKELVTLREYTPEDGSDRLLAKTSQFISASPNQDASVFAGASRSKASPYVLILLRAAHREMTLCEHAASDPAMVRPLFTPDSQSVLFVSDRHGKPAIYMMPVAKFVEATGDGQ